VGGHRPRVHGPDRAGQARGRHGCAVGRGPPRRRPCARGHDAGPPGRPEPAAFQRPLPVAGGEPVRGGQVGLVATSAASRTGSPLTSRAESRKHQATAQSRRSEGLPGPVAPDREVLRRQLRTAAAGTGSLPEFFGRLRADGLLVRERFSERNPGEITGSAVALPDRYDTGGKPIYFGGGKLATDLTVPRLQRRWPGGAPADTAPPAGADRAQHRRCPGRPGGPVQADANRAAADLGAGEPGRGQRHRTDHVQRAQRPGRVRRGRGLGRLGLPGRRRPRRRGTPRRSAVRRRAGLRRGRPGAVRPAPRADSGRSRSARCRSVAAGGARRQAQRNQATARATCAAGGARRRRHPAARDPAAGRAGSSRPSGRRTAARRRRPLPAAGRLGQAWDGDGRPRPDRATRLAQRRVARAEDLARSASLRRK